MCFQNVAYVSSIKASLTILLSGKRISFYEGKKSALSQS